MKKLFLITLLVACAATVFAQPDRVLSTAEKEILMTDTQFQSECVGALKDFAAYWKDASDANIKVGQVGYARWSHNYHWAYKVSANLAILSNKQAIAEEFCFLLKGMILWDNDDATFTAAEVVAYMKQNPSKFDELATLYVTANTVTPADY